MENFHQITTKLMVQEIMTHFDTYGKMATKDVDTTCQNGRYSIQKEYEQNIPFDVAKKLCLTSSDNVLDIGCGLGLNIAPMAKIVKSVTGCDHPNVIKKTTQQINKDNVSLIGGNFLELAFDRQYEKILAYSVLPALPSEKVVIKFIKKALTLITPDGRILLGDIANSDKKKRFINSKRGKEFSERWNESFLQNNSENDLSDFSDSTPVVTFNDEIILKVLSFIREQGFHAYLTDQPHNLPFGNTREDIVIVGPEYESI